MKKRLLISKIFGILGIIIFAVGISYIITYRLDKENFQDINLLVTFEDTKTFTLENNKMLTKEEALKTYPYKFTVKNKNSKTNYEIIIEDVSKEKVERDNLNYILYKNNKEIKSGSLKDIKDNILIEDTIDYKKANEYSLYIYLTKEIENANYEYKLIVNHNK